MNSWGTLLGRKGRVSLYHDTDTGPNQFSVVVRLNGKEVGSGSLACAIDNAEVIGDREAAIALTDAEVDWLVDQQEFCDR
jgi:hypothetical protein